MNWIGNGGALDPAIAWTLRVFLALVFARALVAKLRDPRHFAQAIRGYDLLPSASIAGSAAALLAVEMLLLPTLLLPATARPAAVCATALLLVYSLAIAINLIRGRRDIDCGCAGPLRTQPLHRLLVFRNLLYAAMAGLAAMPLAPRSLIWMDGFTIAVAVSTLGALAIALDGLAASAPTLESLRASS